MTGWEVRFDNDGWYSVERGTPDDGGVVVAASGMSDYASRVLLRRPATFVMGRSSDERQAFGAPSLLWASVYMAR